MPSPSLRLLDLNIERDRHLAAVEELVAKEEPDLACFQEITRTTFERWKGQLFPHGLFAPMTPPESIPHGEWGVAILSQAPLQPIAHEQYDAFTEDHPEFRAKRSERPLVCLLAAVSADLPTVTLATTHFTWTPDGKASQEQRVNLQRLLALTKGYPQLVLCGDFNAPRGGEIFAGLASHFTDNLPTDWTSTLDPLLHRAGPLSLVVDGLFSRGAVQVSDCRKVEGVSDHCAILATIDTEVAASSTP